MKLSNWDLQALSSAHTGTGLETVCWGAVVEIRQLRQKVKALTSGIDNLVESIKDNYGSDFDEDEEMVDGVIDADLILEDLQQILRNAEKIS